jgi:glutathione S-transferase
MAIEFYYMGGGPFAWRCLLALAVKKLAYTPIVMVPARGDLKTSTFLALNPRGTLPVLRDGEVVVRESQAIMFYLDRAYPDRPLYGRSPAEAAAVMQEICEQGSHLEALLRKVIGPLLFGAAGLSSIGEVAAPLCEELSMLDYRLAKQKWIAGDAISAADIHLYPLLPTFERALRQPAAAEVAQSLPAIEETYPNIIQWMRAIQSLDGYAESVPGT